ARVRLIEPIQETEQLQRTFEPISFRRCKRQVIVSQTHKVRVCLATKRARSKVVGQFLILSRRNLAYRGKRREFLEIFVSESAAGHWSPPGSAARRFSPSASCSLTKLRNFSMPR